MTAMAQRRLAMIRALSLFSGSLGASAFSLDASAGSQGRREWKDPRARTYDTYLSAWSPMAAEKRLALLQDSLPDDVVFTNPMQRRRGIAEVIVHLEGFQKRSPGAMFRMNEMLGWENHGIATWQFVDAQGEPGFWGYDIVDFDPSGRIRSILLIGHSEKTLLV